VNITAELFLHLVKGLCQKCILTNGTTCLWSCSKANVHLFTKGCRNVNNIFELTNNQMFPLSRTMEGDIVFISVFISTRRGCRLSACYI